MTERTLSTGPANDANAQRLLLAAQRGDLEEIRNVLRAGADLNAQNHRGESAVLLAAKGSHHEVVRFLIEAGADIDAQDQTSLNVFLFGCITGDLGLVRMAVESGTDLSLLTRFGANGLTPAAEKGHVEIVRYLLDHTDINPNLTNTLGWTALIEAIILGDGGPAQQEIVRLLLAGDADPELTDEWGVSPLTLARNKQFHSIAHIIEAALAATQAERTGDTVVRSIPGTGHGDLFVVTESHSDKIAFVNLADASSPVESETTVGAAPWAIAVHHPSRRGYVSTALGLAVVDLDTRERLSLTPYLAQPEVIEYGEYRPGGTGVVVTPDGSAVYVGVHRADLNSVVERFDTATSTFTDSFEVGLRPFDVQISPSGHEVYTIDHDSFTLHTISVPGHEVTSTMIAPFGTEGGLMSHYKPHYAAVAADGTLFLPYQGKGLVRYSPETRTYTTEPMTADSHQHGTALTSDGRLLVVGVGPIGGATLGPSLTIRDIASGTESLVRLEKGHENPIEWLDSPDGRPKAVLTGGSTSRGSWDGIAVIDLETHEIEEYPVPHLPQMGVFITSNPLT